MASAGFIIREGENAPFLRTLTTLRLGGRALAKVSLREAEAAAGLPEIAARLGGRLVSLGAGSNILAAEGELPLVLVQNALDPEIAVLAEEKERTIVRANGSVKLPLLIARLASMDLGGMEGLTGIPGTVGGAVAMNAGSYGQSIADTLIAITMVTETGVVKRMSRAEIAFGYRHMAVPGHESWFLILSAEFGLVKAEAGITAVRGKEIMAKKKATQPVAAASAGCVFKNPADGISAGKLLDEAGFKGKRLGGMAFSQLHANFLINQGKGRSAEAFELLEKAQIAVKDRSGVILQPEVKIWA